MQEISNIIDILERTKEAVRTENVVLLKELSDKTIHTASINQDIDNIAIAVIVYALSKIIERKNYRQYKNWKIFFRNYINCINNALRYLRKDNIVQFRKEIECIRTEIGKISGNLKKHIQDVFRKASINKASRIYEHGISMEQTSRLLGITLWELAEYSGQTGISDVDLGVTLPVKQRIKNAMEIFEK